MMAWQGPKFAFWRYMCDKKHSRRFVDDLIESFLADEIIPDLLIDVLSGKKFLVNTTTNLLPCY